MWALEKIRYLQEMRWTNTPSLGSSEPGALRLGQPQCSVVVWFTPIVSFKPHSHPHYHLTDWDTKVKRNLFSSTVLGSGGVNDQMGSVKSHSPLSSWHQYPILKATEGERAEIQAPECEAETQTWLKSEKNQCSVPTGPHNLASEPRQLPSFLGQHWGQTSLSVIPEGVCELQNLDPQSLSSPSWKREPANSWWIRQACF